MGLEHNMPELRLGAEVMRSLLPETKPYIDCLWHCRQSAAYQVSDDPDEI